MNAPEPLLLTTAPRWKWLPTIGTWKYHALLASVGMFILGPLGGIAASYMNFSLGFFVGGQVLAGILGSVITFGYGAEGKHGANYMQTTAASVAGMSAMGVLMQAMVWLGLPQPPFVSLVLYMLCIGMFGAGVGMLYTPMLVDRLKLTYPSGLAVSNILRALAEPVMLKRSIGTLGGGMLAGVLGGITSVQLPLLAPLSISMSTLGAGMVVGARIGIPAIVAGLIYRSLVPYFISIGWLHEGEPFRKIAFLIALGMILGAAIIDLLLIAAQTAKRLKALDGKATRSTDVWQQTDTKRLIVWILVWALGVVFVGATLLHEPLKWLLLAIGLVFIFAMINGISVGISDTNPIGSAFVVTVFLMAALGLRDPLLGLIAAAVLLVSTNVACDMQQDRSTGWRLGTNRVIQFRYQVGGIVVGAITAVAFARVFMSAYPELSLDQTVMNIAQQPAQWTSAMTYKFVGTLRTLTEDKPYQRSAMCIGFFIGLLLQTLRRAIKGNERLRRFAGSSRLGFCAEYGLDVFVAPSPYALAFGGFVNLITSFYFSVGSVLSSLINFAARRKSGMVDTAVPEDMSAASLVGGGLIAGDALAALGIGVVGLMLNLFR